MSGSWPPNPNQYPDQGGQRPPYQGYGSREQSYGGYGPPSGGGQRPQYDEYNAPRPDYAGYAPPSQGRPQPGQQGGWGPAQGGGWQDAPQPRGPYPGQGGPQPGGQYGSPYGPQYGSPYGQQYGSGQGFQNAPAPKKRNMLLPLLGAVLLVLVAAGAVGAYELTHHSQPTTSASTTPSATATPGIPNGFKAYDDAAAHVHMLVPTDWTSQGSVSGSSGLILVSADQNSGVIAKQYNFVGNNTGAADGAISGAAGSSGSVANKTGPTNVTVGGQTWIQETADITRDGQTLHMVALVTTYNQSTYLLGYFSLTSSFANVDKSYFQPIVKSFTFTK